VVRSMLRTYSTEVVLRSRKKRRQDAGATGGELFR
jgi:hypothetical protein